MTDDFWALVNRYRSTGVLLDTNILLLYLIGRFDCSRIERFKRTAQYMPEDFDILTRVLSPFERIRTLPHVLAEVNSLSGQLPSDILNDFRQQFAADIHAMHESWRRSVEACDRAEFVFLGLTDSAILVESIGQFLVITDDLRLFAALRRAGVDAINFTMLRSLS